MALNLWCNQFIKETFYNSPIATLIIFVFLINSQQILANNDNINTDANLENIIHNYYNLYLSNSIIDGNVSYKSFFQPKTKNNTEYLWSGILVAFFIDDNGNLREDSNNNLRLDSTDSIVNISYDLNTDNIKVTKTSAHNSNFNLKNYTINEISAIWNTDKLATMYNNIDKLGPKEYKITSPEKRYIFTKNSENLNTLINDFCNLNYKYFNLYTNNFKVLY